MSKKHIGSSFDDFLKEEGLFEEATSHAIKRVIAWQLAEAMQAKKISKAEMARRMNTSRTQVQRFLDPEAVGLFGEDRAWDRGTRCRERGFPS